MIYEVKIEEGYINCPFRTDTWVCFFNSEIGCPDGVVFAPGHGLNEKFPKECPLLKEDIVVKIKKD